MQRRQETGFAFVFIAALLLAAAPGFCTAADVATPTAVVRTAEIFGFVGNYTTLPAVVTPSKITRLNGVVNVSKPVENFSCAGTPESDCTCNLELVNVNGRLQENDFIPDATGESGSYLYNLSCKFFPPVYGNYSIFAYDVAASTDDVKVRTNTIGIQLVPGQLPVVYIVAPVEPVPAIAIAASVVIALGMLAFGAFALCDLMFKSARRISQLEAQKQQAVEDIKMAKYRFMKRQIDEAAFRRTMAEKEKEYTLVVSQLKTLRKDIKDAEQ